VALGLPPMRSVSSSRQIIRWNEQVARFKASRHREPRQPDGEPNGETGWAEPRALPSERLVLGIYGSHFLFEVVDPPGWAIGSSISWSMAPLWLGSCPATAGGKPRESLSYSWTTTCSVPAQLAVAVLGRNVELRLRPPTASIGASKVAAQHDL
jgi:hypothetical protein